MTIKQSDIAYFLHSVFIIGLILSCFITDYKYVNYIIIILVYICFLWAVQGCILKDYENFLKCQEDNEDVCPTANRINIFKLDAWYISLIFLLIICILRIKYQFNFYTSFYAFDISILCITLEILILIAIVIKHYQKYKNLKLLILYIISLIGSLFTCFSYFLH
jgi:hypothetical protein